MTLGGWIVVTRRGSPWRGLAGQVTVHGTVQIAAGVADRNQAGAERVGAAPLSVRPVELRILPAARQQGEPT